MEPGRVYFILFGCSLLFVLSAGRRRRGVVEKVLCKIDLADLFDCWEEEQQEKDCTDDWLCYHECPVGHFGKSCQDDCPPSCEGSCDRMMGYCESCKIGKHGFFCEDDCNPGCADGKCSQHYGYCQSCKVGYYGTSCEMECRSSCMGPCDSETGECLGCPRGKTGLYCEDDCSMNCLGGICDQETRICDGCIAGKSGNFCEIADTLPSSEQQTTTSNNPWPIIVGIAAAVLILAGVTLWCRLSVKREQKNREAALAPAGGQELSSSSPANSPKPCPPPAPKPAVATKSRSNTVAGKPSPLLVPPQRMLKSQKAKNQAESSTYSHLLPYSELDLTNDYVDVNTRSNCYADVEGRRPSSSYAEMEDRRPGSSYAEMEELRPVSSHTGIYECVDDLGVYHQPIECKGEGHTVDPSRLNMKSSVRSAQNTYTLASEV